MPDRLVEGLDGASNLPGERILIGIPTRGRRKPLERLLKSLQGLFPSGQGVSVLVVQNEAQLTISDLPDAFPDLDILIRHEPRIGLCHVRNRLFDEAEALGADWFLGLDDDEWVDAGWFDAMSRCIASAPDRSLYFGPCLYHYDAEKSPFVEASQITKVASGQSPPLMATHNFAAPASLFAAGAGPRLRFDIAFNETGGEDTEFFARATDLFGFVAVWAADAVTNEECRGNRGTLGYMLTQVRRNLTNGLAVEVLHARLEGQRFRLTAARRSAALINRNVILGIGLLIRGCVLTVMSRDSGPEKVGAGLARFYSILGIFDYLFGARRTHYGARTVQDNIDVTIRTGGSR